MIDHRHAEWSRGTLTTTAIGRFGHREYRCRIRHNAWAESPPEVTFAYRQPNHDIDAFSSWSTVHYNRLGGPNDLRSWRAFFTIFEAAFDAYLQAIEQSDYYNRAWPDIACPACGSHRSPVAIVDMTPSGGVDERCPECGFTPDDGQTEPAAERTGGREEVTDS